MESNRELNVDKIDARIAQLAEQQREMHAQMMAEFAELKIMNQQQLEIARKQGENIEKQAKSIEKQGENLEKQAKSIEKQGENLEKQGENIKRQADSIQSLAQAFVEQAKAYREFSRTLPDVVEATRRSAQASEGAAFMAQRTLEAIRDMIEEMREQRNR